ncbi:MAG: GSCFA domain-containing protein [Flavobacteriales bacterium]
MNLKTEIKLPSYPFTLTHENKIISIGSCFSENMGQKLEENKFDICINPFGILFNPISVCTAINQCIENKKYSESDLDSNNEIQFSFNHHSSFSSSTKEETLEKITEGIEKGNNYLTKSKTIIITLGSAWVYRLIETKEVVANCYKIPQNLFKKELVSVPEIVEALSESIFRIREINPDVNIVTTISPVRHWKDGVVENQQSKSTLHLALKEINQQNANCHYFPSYEIMMDELRDYRFYAKDMLHPSELAIDYIWEKFCDSFFTKETKELNKRISQIEREKKHRPFNPESTEYNSFTEKLIEKENQLHKEFPFLRR